MSRAEDIGAAIGRALGRAVEVLGLGDAIRDRYAAEFGRCRRCDAPLGGRSPERVCETCHVDEALSRTVTDEGVDT